VYEEREPERKRFPQVELARDRYQAPFKQHTDIKLEIEREPRREAERPRREAEIDITEREYRRRTDPRYDIEYERRAPRENIHIEAETTVEAPTKSKMGYYDDSGEYHSFRRGLERAADRVLHPLHHHHDREREEIVIERRESGPSRARESTRESVRFEERGGNERGGFPDTVSIPTHHIRTGDLLILQGRPCQVIRITTSAQTGQHRYLGVDLFTKQLHEESSSVSRPSPSVVVQTMYGPLFKQYRVLDIRDDGRVVAMTETGDVKQGLSVLDQGGLSSRLREAFADGRGSVRVLVISDGGRELAVDYKVIHGSRL
jgi:translation elongation factor P/translation initiation factor 5A